AQFVAGKAAVLTRRSLKKGGASMLWELRGDSRSLQDLALLAQLLSGYQQDYAGASSEKTLTQARDAWRSLRARYTNDFTVSAEEVGGWHLREAAASELEGQWRAAVFHWDYLVLARPEDPVFRERRIQAQEKLRQTSGGAM